MATSTESIGTLARIASIIASLCLSGPMLPAQEPASGSTPYRRHSLFIEVMLLFAASANVSYDYRFLDRLSARIGFGTAPFLGRDSTPLGIPLMIDYLGGGGNGYFEAGGGIILPLNYSTIYPTMSIGYRHQPVDGGITWRIAWRPVFIPLEGQNQLALMLASSTAGFSVGYTF
jgi:hypothetical protein